MAVCITWHAGVQVLFQHPAGPGAVIAGEGAVVGHSICCCGVEVGDKVQNVQDALLHAQPAHMHSCSQDARQLCLGLQGLLVGALALSAHTAGQMHT